MNVTEASTRYLEAGRFFEPDYNRDHDVLASFRQANPILSEEHSRELIELLSGNEWRPKYFVADLLYYYQSAPEALLTPMLRAAIQLGDPSFNRIFLRPSLTLYGNHVVLNCLAELFRTGSITDRIGVSLLTYWLRISRVDITALSRLIEQAAETTDNLVELYHYKLALPHRKDRFPDIPDDAASLQERIRGNAEYEHLLYNDLGWQASH